MEESEKKLILTQAMNIREIAAGLIGVIDESDVNGLFEIAEDLTVACGVYN